VAVVTAVPAAAPAVSVVIPTRDRPGQLRAAIRAVAAQDYAGEVDVAVVYDRAEPDAALAEEDLGVPVRVLWNDRTPGLCGARNTGILGTKGDLVAFCDDDDVWLPGKLTAQVAALAGRPAAELVSTSIVVSFDGAESARLAGRAEVTHADLLRSRMAMLHSSTFLVRRSALLDGIGLLDEEIPGGMCEDWDLLLRASARQPVVHVDRPLVRVLWGETSFFARRWETKLAAHLWMLERHPDIWTSRVGAGRVLGQIAFDNAALGRRRAAAGYAVRALRRNPREHRAALALLVAARVVPASAVLAFLHRRGRGI
jgi:glycosyltransferase involved in cell wall biosynthesis